MSSTKTTNDIKGFATYDLTGLLSFGLDEVLLTDDYYINANQKEISYLLTFDVDKLLAGFRDTAGIATKGAVRYPGWETSLIGGHTLGHFLTACAQGYKSVNSSNSQKQKLFTILSAILHGLKETQEAVGTGFLFGTTILDRNNIELQFDNVEKNQTNIFTQAWVPWYTMHKTIAGLITVAQLKDNDAEELATEALAIASGLGDWTYNRTSRWSEDTRNTVLNIEYGGMNDCLYDLFRLSKKATHAEAAHAFDQTALFDKVLNGKPGDNVLNNYHANTTIPKFLGALNRYITYLQDTSVNADIYLKYAQAFWDMVSTNHTYITGGNSEWEHFGPDGILDAERTNCTCETCNVYNMLKLTKKLFMLTGNVKYADFYENTFLNSILSSQNPETGMTMYFQPMATGYFKVYGEEYNKFWCCTGTGMENFTKLAESFYYKKKNLLVVNQYVSSELTWNEKKVTVIQETRIPITENALFTLRTADGQPTDITLAFRLPDWLSADAVIRLDGSIYPYTSEGSYAFVNGSFADGAKIEITLPMKVQVFTLPDNENVCGFKYGPVVLSALLGTSDMSKSTTGVDVTIPSTKLVETSYNGSGDENIVVMTDTVKEYIDHINDYMVRDTSVDQLSFRLKNTDANLTFVTHYSQHKERYGIYWHLISNNLPSDSIPTLTGSGSKWFEALLLDTVQPGYGQYENDPLHNMLEYGNGSTGDTSIGTSRYANKGGSFSYRVLVDTKGTNLLITLKKEDNGKSLKITVADVVIYEQKLQSDSETDEYDVLIPLPKDLLLSNTEAVVFNAQELPAVTFTIAGINGEASARLCGFIYSIKACDN